jgi:hypothetical protein
MAYVRHRRKPRVRFNHMTMPLEAVAASEFPANDPEVAPRFAETREGMVCLPKGEWVDLVEVEGDRLLTPVKPGWTVERFG